MLKECDTTRVPGRIDRICGLSFMLSAGSRYMVTTVAWLKSEAKMSARRKLAFSATPAWRAFSCESFTMSGLYSMPSARAPNFFAAMIAILPSPEPRSMTKSFGVTCAIVSMRSTTSSGVGTQITSLPACPTWGWNPVCAHAGAPSIKVRSRVAARTREFITVSEGNEGQRNVAERPGRLGEHAPARIYSLQSFGSVIGQPGALAAGERHMPGVPPVLHAIDDVSEARRALGKVRRVDLRDVAQAHHFGARAGARHQRLHLLRREVLRLVDDQPLVDEGAPAHEVERLDADARSDQVAGRGAAPFTARLVRGVEHIEVVFERAHPGLHLLFLGAGEEADVLAERHRDARHDDLGVALVIQHLGEAGGKREQGLAGARLAEQRDEIDRRIHEQVEGEVLLAVARGDAPHRVLRVRIVAQRLDHRHAPGSFLDQRVQRTLAGFVVDELVQVQLRHQRSADAVVGVAILLPRLDVAPVRIPEILGQGPHAGVEEVGVLQHLVVVVVLGGEAERARLDAHVDV